ncbi:MAG: M1 family peptidase, partial [Bacteroidota bacterium]
RETVIGEELFDIAFKEYANRWKYKHPNPSDLFRTLEDQSAVDLDWFWKGWFFTTDNVDIELTNVRWFKIKQEESGIERKVNKGSAASIKGNGIPNNGKDFSGGPEEFEMSSTPATGYRQFLSRIDEGAVRGKLADQHIYEITLKNRGGLVMPVIIQWNYVDGTSEIETLPAEIWRLNESQVTKTFLKKKEVASVILDPEQAIADVNTRNNAFPRNAQGSAFDRFKKSGN